MLDQLLSPFALDTFRRVIDLVALFLYLFMYPIFALCVIYASAVTIGCFIWLIVTFSHAMNNDGQQEEK